MISLKKPEFFIIGAPKCGTTALNDYLAVHPDIFMGRKEMHYFGKDLQFGSNFFRRNTSEYLAEFAGSKNEKRIGEASVWYLYSKTAAKEIREFNPDARIVIMLRNPADMLFSLYSFFCGDLNEHLGSFREALEAQSDRLTGRKISRSTYFKQGLIYLDVPRYTEQVSRYFEVFGRERVQVIIYDDFAADTRAVFKQVLSFLEVDSDWNLDSFPVVNGSPTLKYPFVKKITSDPWIRGTAIALRRYIPKSMFTALQNFESSIMELNVQRGKRTPCDPQLKKQLKQTFTMEVENLSQLLDRDLTHWNQAEPAHKSLPKQNQPLSELLQPQVVEAS